jgi:hypothetical protein
VRQGFLLVEVLLACALCVFMAVLWGHWMVRINKTTCKLRQAVHTVGDGYDGKSFGKPFVR